LRFDAEQLESALLDLGLGTPGRIKSEFAIVGGCRLSDHSCTEAKVPIGHSADRATDAVLILAMLLAAAPYRASGFVL
jgi:hypothetical protein